MTDVAEGTRRLSAKERVLQMLQAQGEATNIQLNALTFRYGARIFELRKEGFDITTEAKGDGVFRFVYRGRAVPSPRLPFEQG
jgi:hypothetical protein